MVKLSMRLFLWVSILIFVVSCSGVSVNFCPNFPIAGYKVAKELEQTGDFPHTWEWIARLYKLKQELDICKTPTAP